MRHRTKTCPLYFGIVCRFWRHNRITRHMRLLIHSARDQGRKSPETNSSSRSRCDSFSLEGRAGSLNGGGTVHKSYWCPGPELNRYVPFGTRDFKSRASASFATRATKIQLVPPVW